jgi:hypothetical protein
MAATVMSSIYTIQVPNTEDMKMGRGSPLPRSTAKRSTTLQRGSSRQGMTNKRTKLPEKTENKIRGIMEGSAGQFSGNQKQSILWNKAFGKSVDQAVDAKMDRLWGLTHGSIEKKMTGEEKIKILNQVLASVDELADQNPTRANKLVATEYRSRVDRWEKFLNRS